MENTAHILDIFYLRTASDSLPLCKKSCITICTDAKWYHVCTVRKDGNVIRQLMHIRKPLEIAFASERPLHTRSSLVRKVESEEVLVASNPKEGEFVSYTWGALHKRLTRVNSKRSGASRPFVLVPFIQFTALAFLTRSSA